VARSIWRWPTPSYGHWQARATYLSDMVATVGSIHDNGSMGAAYDKGALELCLSTENFTILTTRWSHCLFRLLCAVYLSPVLTEKISGRLVGVQLGDCGLCRRQILQSSYACPSKS
jgi:hypothetical protein